MVAIATCWATVAAAQGASSRGTTAVFGAAGSTDPRPQHLNITSTLTEAYDDNLLADFGSVTPTGTSDSGYYTMLLVSGDYQWQGRRVQVGASGQSALRYYGEIQEVHSMSHSAGAGFSAALTPRTTVMLNGSAAYSPSYLYGLFPTSAPVEPGDAIPAAPDYNVNAQASYAYGGTAGLTHQYSLRDSVSVTGTFAYTDYLSESELYHDLSNYGVEAAYSRSLSRHKTLRVSYQHRRGEFGYVFVGQSVENGINVGLQFARPISATRQAQFAFNLGTTLVDLPASTLPGGVSGRQYRATGGATVSYDLARTWQVNGSYRRGIDYVPALRDPVFMNGFSVGLAGLLSRRTDLSASVGYSTGASALTQRASAYDTYTGTVQVRYALGRTWAIYTEYLYYFYDFGNAGGLLRGVPSTLKRNGVRAGVTLWLPVIGR